MGASVDVIGLLRLGEHSTMRTLADARFSEAVLRHRERAWEVALAIAEAYEVERALEGLPVPVVTLPVDAYVRAGLAPESARDAAAANEGGLRAEEEERRAQREENRAALLRLLGVAPDAAADAFRLVGDTGLPAQVEPLPRDALLRARPDLQREVATYRVADQEFRRAVAGQYPHLTVEPPLEGEIGWHLLGVTLPFRGPAEARSAWTAREAARLEAKSAVLDAIEEARRETAAARAAASSHAAALARAEASAALLSTARTRLEAESEAFFEAVFAAGDAVEATAGLREAAVARARARARAARAVGWPASHGVPVSLLPVGPCR
jgi:outer membrane protein TolC